MGRFFNNHSLLFHTFSAGGTDPYHLFANHTAVESPRMPILAKGISFISGAFSGTKLEEERISFVLAR